MSTTEELGRAIEIRRGRALSAAEKNIDIAGMQSALEDGKLALAAAIEDAQAAAVKRWQAAGHRGQIRVKVTPAMQKILDGLAQAGEEHGHAELRKAGYSGYSAKSRRRKLQKLLADLRTKLGGINFRLRKRSTELDLSTLSKGKIAEALAKVPGALDVAGRMVSSAMYQGLGAAFDQASGLVDQADGGGGNGWEYTAVMDGGTCDPCAESDGTEYATFDDAEVDLPGGGPNPDCDGDGRCRCRIAPKPL